MLCTAPYLGERRSRVSYDPLVGFEVLLENPRGKHRAADVRRKLDSRSSVRVD